MKRFFGLLIGALIALAPASAQSPQVRAVLLGVRGPAAATCTPGTQASAFFTRVTAASITLDATHTAMYCNLINGLVADGVFSKLDLLYFLSTNATAGSAATLASLNLVSSSFTITLNGAPTFTADQGYTGVDASTTVSLNTNYDPSTAGLNYSQNSAHLSLWVNNNVTASASGGSAMGNSNAPQSLGTFIYPKYVDGNSYYRTQESASAGIARTSSVGFHLGTRNAASGAGSELGYYNAVDQGITPVASVALQPGAIFILACDSNGNTINGSAVQVSAASLGGALTAADVTNLYNRLSTARAAVGL